MIRDTIVPQHPDPVTLAELESVVHHYESPETCRCPSASDTALDRLMRWDPKAGREGIDALTVSMVTDSLQRMLAWVLVHQGQLVGHRLAAAFLGIDGKALHKLAITGQLIPINDSGHAMWRAEDLQRFVRSLPSPVKSE